MSQRAFEGRDPAADEKLDNAAAELAAKRREENRRVRADVWERAES